jgi:hypothetical protein
MRVIHIDPPVMARFAWLAADWVQDRNRALQKSTFGVPQFGQSCFTDSQVSTRLLLPGKSYCDAPDALYLDGHREWCNISAIQLRNNDSA